MTSGARRDLERKDSRDPASGVASRGTANAVEKEDEEEAVPFGGVRMIRAVDEYEDESSWVMVKDKWLAKGVNAKQDVEVRNRFEELAVQTDKDQKMTRTSAIEFNVAEVRKPLASWWRSTRTARSWSTRAWANG